MKQLVAELLSRKTKLPKEQIADIIEIPPNIEMGDYAFPCFALSEKLRKPPAEIALEFARDLNREKIKGIEKIESKGPYLNFFVNKKNFVKEILSKASVPEYGSKKEKQKILVEHTSVNPNASPHVGRARNSIIGDSIVRILKFLGNKVEVHYYVNDVSKQIAMLALVYKSGDKFNGMLNNYIKIAKMVEDDGKLQRQVFELLEKFESKDKQTVAKFKKIVDICVKGQKEIFAELGINFDSFDYESKYTQKDSKEILKKLEATGKLFEDKENRLVLNQSNTNLVKKMKSPVLVLTRSNKTGLYPLRDIAYSIEKEKFGRNIIVLGADQKLYFEQVAEALKLLGAKPPEVVHYSFVLIRSDGKTKKMATRKGEIVLLEEFLNETIKKAKAEIDKRKTKGDPKKIAIAAIKYSMLKNDNDKDIVFDWNRSLNFEGDSGPYLQYSYARACSIIKKSKKGKKRQETIDVLGIPEITKNEFILAKKISEFPEIVEKAAKKLNPSIIANYSFQLAQIFNEFYHNCRVIGDEKQVFRLKLVNAFRNTLKNSLNLLGIDIMEEM